LSLDLFVSSGGQLALQLLVLAVPFIFKIGRASCRERV